MEPNKPPQLRTRYIYDYEYHSPGPSYEYSIKYGRLFFLSIITAAPLARSSAKQADRKGIIAGPLLSSPLAAGPAIPLSMRPS